MWRRAVFAAIVLAFTSSASFATAAPKSDYYEFINDNGICGGDRQQCSVSEAQYGLAQDAGFGWVRLWVYWNRVNPSPGVFDWKDLDTQFQRAKTAGMKIHWQIAWAPSWATGGIPAFEPFHCMATTNGRHYFRSTAKECADPVLPNKSAYASFLQELVRHFSENEVGFLSCWNEPGDRIYYPGGWWTYMDTIQAPCYDALKAVNPDIMIVGPEQPTAPWLKRNFLWEVDHKRPAFDIVSFHLFYSFGGDIPTYSRQVIRSLDRRFLPLIGAYQTITYPNGKKVKRPVWMTATGVSADQSNPVELEEQAEAYTKVFGALEARPQISKYTLYRLTELFLKDGTPTPAYYALKRLILDD